MRRGAWPRQRPRLVVLLSALVPVLLVAAVACSDDGGGDTDTSSGASDGAGAVRPEDEAAAAGGAPFVEPGPYLVGTSSLALASGARVEVWYPALDGADDGEQPVAFDLRDEVPAALLEGLDGVDELDTSFQTEAFRDVAPAPSTEPFPFVVVAHGAASFPNASASLTTHLASWGFVVAAPEVLSRSLAGQLSGGGDGGQGDVEVVEETAAVVADAGGPLAGLTDTSELAVVGHSAGGGTAGQMSREPGVVTYVPMSSGTAARDAAETPLGDVPSLWVTGSDDGIAELEGVEAGWERAAAPTRLLVVDGAGHNDAFTDVCEIGEVPGGAVGLALEVGFPVPASLQALGLDGCVPEGLPSADGQALVRQAVTAQLRWAFGLDEQPVGLDEASLEQVGTPFVLEERLD